MRIDVGASSDIGQVREGNEDAYLILDPLFAVADGMGGHRGGEVASNLALEIVRSRFEGREGSLTEQVEAANREVFERSQADREVSGMGTTLTAALVEGEQVRLAHVGDSRAYRSGMGSSTCSRRTTRSCTAWCRRGRSPPRRPRRTRTAAS
jgi:protein phosphatase